MRRLTQFFESSIAKKMTIALAGVLLFGFLLVHLAGNLFLLSGPEAFNDYASHLAQNPILPAAEIILLAIFLVHIGVSLAARSQNRGARPIGYEIHAGKGARTWGSRSMTYTALILLAFLVVHLKAFRFASNRSDLYALVMASFHSGFCVLFYIAAMGALALHLSHGLQSALQTFGFHHPRYTPLARKAGFCLAILISLGFAILPVWAYITGGAR
ncbi:MAG: succinate dehydrogenase cytochrome b subunit [Elusimicrobiota bacterium]